MKRILNRSLTCEIDVAWDGEEAINRTYGVGEYSLLPLPHLIILDLNLPKVDGLVVLEKLKDNNATRAIPVVVLTVSTRDRDRDRAYDLGAATYMVKPTSNHEFERLLEIITSYWSKMALP